MLQGLQRPEQAGNVLVVVEQVRASNPARIPGTDGDAYVHQVVTDIGKGGHLAQ